MLSLSKHTAKAFALTLRQAQDDTHLLSANKNNGKTAWGVILPYFAFFLNFFAFNGYGAFAY